jgi:ELWxxDGT repeat protein
MEVLANTNESNLDDIETNNGNYYLRYYNSVWKTDGTASGTSELTLPGLPKLTSKGNDHFEIINNKLFYRSDTTTESFLSTYDLLTSQISNMKLLPNVNAIPISFFPFNNKLFFSAGNSQDGVAFEPWLSDGTAANTYRLTLITNAQVQIFSDASGAAVLNNVLFFTTAAYPGLWVTTGENTPDATKEVVFGPSSEPLTLPESFFLFNGKLVFTAKYSGDRWLWVTDDTLTQLENIYKFDKGLLYYEYTIPRQNIAVASSAFYFIGEVVGPDTTNTGLIMSDGTAAGTKQVLDSLGNKVVPVQDYVLSDYNRVSDFAYKWIVYNDTLYFVKSDEQHGAELWRVTDGVAQLAIDLRAGPKSSNISSLIVFDNHLYFFADNGAGQALWKSDGTPAGTRRIGIIHTVDPTWDKFVKVYNNKLYIIAGDNCILGRELWELSPDQSDKSIFIGRDCDPNSISVDVHVPVYTPTTNTPPVANAGSDFVVDKSTKVTLVGSGSDSDGDILQYTWAQTGGLPNVTLNSANEATATFTSPDVSKQVVLTFTLAVNDNQGGTGTDEINITVNPVNGQVNNSSSGDGGGGGGALSIIILVLAFPLLRHRSKRQADYEWNS